MANLGVGTQRRGGAKHRDTEEGGDAGKERRNSGDGAWTLGRFLATS